MPQYKLCYFNARGLGEMSRLLFAEAGVDYEDVRYAGEEWPKHKPTMQFGQMPVLFVDGVQIAHSRAMVRYLARELKLNGESSMDAAQIDVWIEVLFEAFQKLPFSIKDEKEKEEAMKNVMKETVGPRLEAMEKVIKATDGPYLLKSISAADIVAYAALDLVQRKFNADLTCFPAVVKLMDAVSERPNIKKWIATRPQTEN